MNKVVQSILTSLKTNEKKLEQIKSLEEDIKFAREIISGKYKYCEKCDDYYLTESFMHKTETKEGKVCIYHDPINSGGNDYADGYIHREYEICPKGHKKLVSESETRK